MRLGATWIDQKYIQQFMEETFEPPYYLRRSIQVHFSPFTAEWSITGKSQPSHSDVNAYMTYGTERANAYRILEDTLNLRDVRIYDTVTDPDGKGASGSQFQRNDPCPAETASHQGCLFRVDMERPGQTAGTCDALQRAVQFQPAARIRWLPYHFQRHEPGDSFEGSIN